MLQVPRVTPIEWLFVEQPPAPQCRRRRRRHVRRRPTAAPIAAARTAPPCHPHRRRPRRAPLRRHRRRHHCRRHRHHRRPAICAAVTPSTTTVCLLDRRNHYCGSATNTVEYLDLNSGVVGRGPNMIEHHTVGTLDAWRLTAHCCRNCRVHRRSARGHDRGVAAALCTSWSTWSARLTTARNHHGAAAYGGVVYVFADKRTDISLQPSRHAHQQPVIHHELQ